MTSKTCPCALHGVRVHYSSTAARRVRCARMTAVAAAVAVLSVAGAHPLSQPCLRTCHWHLQYRAKQGGQSAPFLEKLVHA